MPDSPGELILDQLSRNILGANFQDIDSETVENTKKRILDMLGCAMGGAAAGGSASLARLVKSWGGKREASILGYGYRVPCANAAMVNCIFGRSFDRGPLTNIIDGKRFPNHITETTVLTALALGESTRIGGKELITAIILGDDLSARLHIASDRAQPGQAPAAGESSGGLTRGTSDNFGAAAIAGRLLGLNLGQLKNAFGLINILMGGGASMSRSLAAPPVAQVPNIPAAGAKSGWRGVNDPFFQAEVAKGGYEETTSVKLTQGLIAQRGIVAAQLAAAGWTGVKDAFFGARGGYYPGIESVNHAERVTADLGRRFHVEQVFKPYPGGRPTHAPTEAAIKIARAADFDPAEIVEVILHLSPPAAAIHYSKPFVMGDYPTMSALWSYYYSVASALLRKSSIDEYFTEEAVRDPRVQELISKVKLGDLDQSAGIELEVKMDGGRVFREYVRAAAGEPNRPLTRDELLAKFKEQWEFAGLVEWHKAELLIASCENLEKVPNVAEMVKMAVRR